MTNEHAHQPEIASDSVIPKSEWLVAAMGALLVLASFGFLIYRGVAERQPPVFEFVIEKFAPVGDQNLLMVSIHNRGGRPVAELQIRAIAGSEQREVIIDYVPAKSSRRVAFLWNQATTEAEISFSAEAFTEP